mgnify:FL=1
MPSTLLEKWNALFPNGSPDADPVATSKTSDAITNPLSDVSGLDNEYTSTSPIPSGRKSQSISVLWSHFCDVGDDSDASIKHLTTGFGDDTSGGHDPKYSAKIRAMGKNVTVRTTEDMAGFQTRVLSAGSIAAAFALADGGPASLATVKGNYRLGSVNPDGGFSNYTGRPMSNGGDDIATISLQQYRDGMG